jgi:DNA ligase-1
MEDRSKVSGMINSAIHGKPIDEDFLKFNCFDTMTSFDFDNKSCNLPYSERFSNLFKNVNIAGDLEILDIAETVLIEDLEELDKLYQKKISEGYEGLILKSNDHKYTFKKNANWIKCKETKEADLLCIGYNEGKGKYEGMIGSLGCTGIVDGKAVSVDVGSGMTDNDRMKDPEEYINSTIEIKYNSLIKDKVTGNYSLFLPRFSRIRFDK